MEEYYAKTLEKNNRPYAAEYVRKFGHKSMIPYYTPTKRQDHEKQYKKCIEKGVKWEELSNFDISDKDIIL